jgi:hypothetical protein
LIITLCGLLIGVVREFDSLESRIRLLEAKDTFMHGMVEVPHVVGRKK